MDILRIGIVGAGVIGDAHASAISGLSDQKVMAIADPIEALRSGLAEKYSIPRTYANWEELVADSEVDVVYIGTPNNLHLPIAVSAMESGKDVVSEKPLARNLAEGKAMVNASERTGRKLFVALNHRFWAPNQRVKQLLDAGEIGKPFLAVSTFIGNEFDRMDDSANWKGTKDKSGGGVVIDNGTHMIDLLRWWLGDAIAVTARTGRLAISAANKEEDTAALAIEFESGAIAELSLTFGARYSAWPKGFCGAAIRTEIFGLDGALKVGNDGESLQYINKDNPPTALEASEISTGLPNVQQAHFAACIRGEAQPIVTALDGLAALEIVEAAYASAQLGQRVLIKS